MRKTIVMPDKRQVIALGVYRGKTVRAIAKCDPKDTFNPETGEALALARLEQKLNYHRRVTAQKRLDEIDSKMEALRTQFEKLSDARERTMENYAKLYDEAYDIEETIKEIIAE